MDPESKTGAPAGLYRRLAALLYDLLLAIAIAFVATAAMLPLTHGEAILNATQGLVGHLYHATWLSAVFVYFGWCWTRSGQTLGMKAWRIQLQTDTGGRMGWAGAIVRYLLGLVIGLLAVLGIWYLSRTGSPLVLSGAVVMTALAILNFAWIAFDGRGRSLQDLVGRVRIVRTS
jgi:uncharacterized RDD family membrane protein YckC